MKHHQSNEKLLSAKYGEWQASLFGACFIAFGLGVLVSNFISNWAWLIILAGIVLHSWGMIRTYSRNK